MGHDLHRIDHGDRSWIKVSNDDGICTDRNVVADVDVAEDFCAYRDRYPVADRG
jgi:hypothetical protein